jgi:hypothetical protein
MAKRRSSDFQDRFKGRTSLMNKEGHIGVVAKIAKPINKQDFSRNETENQATLSLPSKSHQQPCNQLFTFRENKQSNLEKPRYAQRSSPFFPC